MTAGVEPYAVKAIRTAEDVDKILIDADEVDIYEKLGSVHPRSACEKKI